MTMNPNALVDSPHDQPGGVENLDDPGLTTAGKRDFLSRDYIDDRPDAGVFEVAPAVYGSPEFFEWEIKYIFERTWNFLGLESQLAQPNDYFTTRIGRTPVLVTRDKDGNLRAFLNVCRHKGAIVCRSKEGNSPVHSCPYHNWAYDSCGRNVNIKDKVKGGYPANFDNDNHDLIPLARLDSYAGLIFGSLSNEVPSLDVYLGDMKVFLDIILKTGEHGMEYIPGRAHYTFRGNWKLQADNGMDGYHVTSAHISLLKVTERRRRKEKENARTVRAANWNSYNMPGRHYFNFPYGHYIRIHDPDENDEQSLMSSPLHHQRADMVKRLGEERARFMQHHVQMTIFPNFQISNMNSVMLRQFQPLAVDKTEMRVRCLGNIGESRELRTLRLRLFEDFYNASGMASPDDSALYEDCQTGLHAAGMPLFQGYSRGMGVMQAGGNDKARELGINPLYSISDVETGGVFPENGIRLIYREWGRLIEAGVHGRPAYE